MKARAEKAEAERDALRTLWTEARVVVAQCRDANCLVSYGKAQCDAVAAANAWLDKMPATMRRTIDDASNTEWQLQRLIAERDQLRAEVDALKTERDRLHSDLVRRDDETEAQLAAAQATLDWAETLLCNAKPLSHCTQDEWDELVHKWRDQKHRAAIDAARQAQSHSPTTPKPASS